jgi:flavin reductase
MGEALASDFKGAMRALTSAVSIISTSRSGRRFGMTATAVTSVSMAPPSLLVCINQAASLHAPPQTFGSPVGDRFAHGAWLRDDREMPYLADAQANIFCDVDDIHAYGSHTVVIGRVYDVGVHAPVHPLLYQDGRYTVGLSDGVDWVIPIAG